MSPTQMKKRGSYKTGPTKRERENKEKNETHDSEFLEKILLDFGVSGNIKKMVLISNSHINISIF